MVDIITVIFGAIGAFNRFQIYICLFIFVSKTLGDGFYRWIVHDLEFLMVLSFLFFGPTQFIASQVYERFNWFTVRIVLVFYSIGLMILAVFSLCCLGILRI